VIVIDGIKALRDFARVDGFGFRGVSYDLASKVAHSNAILLFVGEYTAEEVAYAPEFAVADGILYLADETFGRFDQRWLRILKLRGADYLMGKHSFRIGVSGIEVFPRFESIAPPRAMWTGERVPLGVEGIDEKIGGRPAARERDPGRGPVGCRQVGSRPALRRRGNLPRRALPVPLLPADRGAADRAR